MCKIIGFTRKVDGYRTTAGFMQSELFKTACNKAAISTGLPIEKVYTKRQANKFLKSKGIVFNHLNT